MKSAVHREYSFALDALHKEGKLYFEEGNPQAEKYIEEVWNKSAEFSPFIENISKLEKLKGRDKPNANYYQKQIDECRESMKPKLLEFGKKIGIKDITLFIVLSDGKMVTKTPEQLEKERKTVEDNYFGYSGGVYDMAAINAKSFGIDTTIYEELARAVMDEYDKLIEKAYDMQQAEEEARYDFKPTKSNLTEEEVEKAKKFLDQTNISPEQEKAREQQELESVKSVLGIDITPYRLESDGMRIYSTDTYKSYEELEDEMYNALDLLEAKKNTISQEEYQRVRNIIDVKYRTMASVAIEREFNEGRSK